MQGVRISMTRLAKLAGVSVSTVSRALGEHPAIPADTRERIRKLADEHGYRPDPMLDALGAYRRNIVKKDYRPTLAVIATGGAWREDIGCRLYHEGAQRRAEALGYRLEVFVVAEKNLTCRRLVGVLETRGIRGAIVLPLMNPDVDLDELTKKFMVVATSYKFAAGVVNRVCFDHFAAMGNALEKLGALGYRRPGLVLATSALSLTPHHAMSYVGDVWRGAYLAGCAKRFPEADIPVIRTADAREFSRWFDRHEPDVLISQNFALHRMDERLAGFPTAYTIVDDNPSLTGIHQNSWQIGRRAVDLLAADLLRSDTVEPAAPVTVLVGSGWQVGTTVGPARRSA